MLEAEVFEEGRHVEGIKGTFVDVQQLVQVFPCASSADLPCELSVEG
jgi:hypothetical protein